MLQNAGPLPEDGSDRYYGFENVSPYSAVCVLVTIDQALLDQCADALFNERTKQSQVC